MAERKKTKSKEVKPPVEPRVLPACPVHGERCPLNGAKPGPGHVFLGVMSFTTRQYPACESTDCKHPAGGMKGERSDKRDRFCEGCGDELKVIIQARPDHCRECGRSQADFFLVCPNERWWHIFGGHFTREFLGSGRLFDDTSDEAKKADAAARARV